MAVQEKSKTNSLEFGCGILVLLLLAAAVVVVAYFPEEAARFFTNSWEWLLAH